MVEWDKVIFGLKQYYGNVVKDVYERLNNDSNQVDHPRIRAVGLVANRSNKMGEVRKVENPFKNREENIAEIFEDIKDFCADCPLRLMKCTNCYLGKWRQEAEK